LSMLSHWTGLNRRTVTNQLQSLMDSDYIIKAETGKVNSWYNKATVQLSRYTLLVPFQNQGEYVLTDNNIEDLYCRLFLDLQTEEETWLDIPGYHGWYQISSQGRVRVKERQLGGKRFPSRILKPFQSASGKSYVHLKGEEKQEKVSIDVLRTLAWEKTGNIESMYLGKKQSVKSKD